MSDSFPSRSRRVLAVAVVVQPVLLAVNSVLHPPVEMSGHGLLHGAAQSPGTWFAVHLTAAVGALLMAPAALGLWTLAGGRGRRPATVGVALSAVTATLLALAFAAEASVLRLAAVADIGEDAALALADAYVRSPESYLIPAGFLAAVLGSLCLGGGLLLARSVPRWQALGYVLGVLAGIVSAPGTVVGPVSSAVVVVVSAFLAARIWRDASTSEGADVRRGDSQVTTA